MHILEKTDVRFHHPDVITLLKANGIRVEGNTAFFRRRQLMQWVSKSPGQFVVHARGQG